MLVFSITGELEEIKNQIVPKGDYIKQYALVKQVSSTGESFIRYCDDCTCSIIVYDDRFNIVVPTSNTNVLNNSLFGYRTNAKFLKDHYYVARFTCISETYGTGIVDSNVLIVDQTVLIAPVQTPDSSLGDWGIGGIGQIISPIDRGNEDNTVIHTIREGFDSLIALIASPFSAPLLFIEGLLKVATEFFSVAFEVVSIILDLIINPELGLNRLYTLIMVRFKVFIMMILPFFILYEVYAFSKAFDQRSSEGMIKTLFEKQVNIFVFFRDVMIYAINGLKGIFMIFIETIKALPGT